ncbi:hypothetical protein MMC22_010953 [Lobaria immixta]|nr:hypothetical protein [Lobaria immixta]
MSTPEDITTNRVSIPNPRGSKRGACDRCRGQKLRCLREDQSQDSPQATCVRCFKAGAICSYGIARRAGRSPGSSAPSPQQPRGNGVGKPKKGGMASRPTVNTSDHNAFFDSKADGRQDRRGAGGLGSGEFTADQASEGEIEDTTPVHALSPLSLHDTSNIFGGVNLDFPAFSASSTATLSWPEETLPPFSNNDAGEASALEPFGSKCSWAFHHYQAQPIDIQRPTTSRVSNNKQSGDMGANAYGIPAQTCSTNAQISGASDEAMDLDLPSSTANFALFKELAEKEVGIKIDENPLSVSEVQHRRMQELSELAMDLYAQLAAHDPENHQPTSGAIATTFQDQLVGSVLKSSNTFLTLLTSFSTPAAPSSPFAPPPTPSTSHNNSTCSSSDSGASPPASALDYDDPAMDEPAQHPHCKLPAGSSDDSKLPPQTDITTVLQLLTCYIRIIHLHSIMYARILDYMLAFLQHTTQHVDSVPPIFPGMQVGGVSLNEFGTFQVKLLLQISVHVLGEIESALGLPEEYRIANRKSEGTGVLRASVSVGFVNSLMKEGAWRGKRVECVREQLKNLRRVLKGAIDF